MADVKFETPIEGWQKSNPIVEIMKVDLPIATINPSDEMMENLFPVKSKMSLKTWGRSKNQHADKDPHWIRVKRGTPLHIDPKYPRYSHHLVLKGEGYLRGVDKRRTSVERGTVYTCDVHSPHQYCSNNAEKNYWYLAVSLDYDIPIRLDEAYFDLLEYALTAEFIKTEE
jgi:hypothetical protein